MADTTTPHYAFVQPQDGASNATWGSKLNAGLLAIDTTVWNNSQVSLQLSGCLPNTDGTIGATKQPMTGPLYSLDILPNDNSARKIGSSSLCYSDVFVQNVIFTLNQATPALSCKQLSGSAGLVLQFAQPTGQKFAIQDSGGTERASITSAGVGTFATLFAAEVTATSDERLKTDVVQIDDALSLLLQLRGVSFNWLESGKPGAGVIAQDVQSVLPSAVHRYEQRLLDSPLLGVEYNQLWALAIEAIRNLAERVTALEGRAPR